MFLQAHLPHLRSRSAIDALPSLEPSFQNNLARETFSDTMNLDDALNHLFRLDFDSGLTFFRGIIEDREESLVTRNRLSIFCQMLKLIKALFASSNETKRAKILGSLWRVANFQGSRLTIVAKGTHLPNMDSDPPPPPSRPLWPPRPSRFLSFVGTDYAQYRTTEIMGLDSRQLLPATASHEINSDEIGLQFDENLGLINFNDEIWPAAAYPSDTALTGFQSSQNPLADHPATCRAYARGSPPNRTVRSRSPSPCREPPQKKRTEGRQKKPEHGKTSRNSKKGTSPSPESDYFSQSFSSKQNALYIVMCYMGFISYPEFREIVVGARAREGRPKTRISSAFGQATNLSQEPFVLVDCRCCNSTPHFFMVGVDKFSSAEGVEKVFQKPKQDTLCLLCFHMGKHQLQSIKRSEKYELCLTSEGMTFLSSPHLKRLLQKLGDDWIPPPFLSGKRLDNPFDSWGEQVVGMKNKEITESGSLLVLSNPGNMNIQPIKVDLLQHIFENDLRPDAFREAVWASFTESEQAAVKKLSPRPTIEGETAKKSIC
jgi:hypothetical protein